MELLDDIYLSTAYFPPVAWFGLAARAKRVHIEACEHFPRQTYRNRFSILSAQGELKLSMPLLRPKGSKTPIREVEAAFLEKWQNMHWRSLESCYNASPFFLYYQDDVKELIYAIKPGDKLLEINDKIIQYFAEKCALKTSFVFTEKFEVPSESPSDWRYRLSPKKSDLIPESCFPEYYQVFENQVFHPNLSILDALFNLGPELPAYVGEVGKLKVGKLKVRKWES